MWDQLSGRDLRGIHLSNKALMLHLSQTPGNTDRTYYPDYSRLDYLGRRK